jgi:dolichol-phosphate mannosyltransferase
MTEHQDSVSRADWPPGRVLVVVATYAEADNVAPLVDRVLAAASDLQMLVVDDDSPDGTGHYALDRAATEPRLHALVRRGRRGLGSALAEGLALARRHGFEVAVTMDADFSHDPDDIPRLLAALEPVAGVPADAVIGSRKVAGGRVVGWPLSRHVASWLVNRFTWYVLRISVRDASSGFRALRLEAYGRIPGPFAESFGFLEQVLWGLSRTGGRFREVPITFVDRRHGSSKADLREAWRSIRDLLRLARRTWLPS